ncbi:MAG: HDOD domain-containing protein [Sedimentisphaerales bacterium]|nr:HDOD domain-containing protein [Sedimentisphaerales bacterium]
MEPAHELARSKSKKIELIIQQLDSLPTLPAVAARLLQITVRSDTQAAEVVGLIESDPALASKIIALATQAGRGVSKKTVSVSKAVVLLGFEAVRHAVLSIQVFEALGQAGEAETPFDRQGFWRHSLAVACAARLLSRRMDAPVDPEEAFVCGLLHDLGKVALDASLPKSFARIVQLTESSLGNIAEMEQRILGIDHTVVGKRLAEKWSLPASIREAIWLHHQPPGSLPPSVEHRSVVQIVHLADLLVREQRIGYSGNHVMPESSLTVAQQLSCPPSAIEEAARRLVEEIQERAELLGLDDVRPDQLYYEALGEANRELGKLNLRLQQQYRSLQRRSMYFDLLSALAEQSQADQTVADLCSLIARLWRQSLECEQCGVYVIGESDQIIEGSVQWAGQAEPSVFLVDRSEDPAVRDQTDIVPEFAGSFAISRADQSHRWFFEQVAPMFEAGRTLMVPLRHGSEVVGGLLWQGPYDAQAYQSELKELQAFAGGAALAVRQAQKRAQQNRLSEELAQVSRLLYETQRELLRKERLAAVGEMACGAAHEVNNPLAVVVGRAQWLASTETDPQRREILERIERNGRQISQIVSELREFAQPAPPAPEMIAPRALIAVAVESLSAFAGERSVRIETDMPATLPDIYVDAKQMESVLAALLQNAIESYRDCAGTVTVRCRYEELEEQLLIEVRDQGCGMSPQTLQKALDPFFSQKPAGRNRGLGLSRSARYIEENGGRLEITSQPDQGSSLTICLPVNRVAQESGT